LAGVARQVRQRVEPGQPAARPVPPLAQPGVSVGRVWQQGEPEALAQQVLRPAGRAVWEQPAALPPERRDAAGARRPEVDGAGARPDAEAVRRPEARPALAALRPVAGAPDAAAEQQAQPWAGPGALAVLPLAAGAWACRPGRLRAAPAPPPAARFAHATTDLQIASP
jgi:hypothetical protein